MKTLQELLNTLPQQGELRWIGLRPERRAEMISVDIAAVSSKSGLEGDRYQGRTGQRHVTLLQEEHLPVIAACVGRRHVRAEDLRRNLLVTGINLLALKNRIISIGSVELEVTGLCHPCSRMEETLGEGGYNAVRGHGGVTARVLTDGHIRVGDSVALNASVSDR
ncbi:MOSC domain-containing protein [Granulosicoccus sp. 3-233]|uniref:MOSC domain-containing protein n=1 Tax=Granulosicoccus sp. 3-233 TaxID=3417969 RepID=UPI003D35236C